MIEDLKHKASGHLRDGVRVVSQIGERVGDAVGEVVVEKTLPWFSPTRPHHSPNDL